MANSKRNVAKNSVKPIVAVAVSIIAVILVITAIFGAIAWGSKGFKEWDASEWFNGWGANVSEENLDIAAVTDDGLIVSLCYEDNESEIMLLNAEVSEESDSDSPKYSEGSAILTAMVVPADAINTDITWTGEFVNSNSTWARGKKVSDYLTITDLETTQNDIHRVIVKKIQGFAEQIQVTAISNDNPEISASCYIDCLALPGNFSDLNATAVLNSDGNTDVSISLINKSDMGVGTVYGEYKFVLDDNINTYCIFLGSSEKSVYTYYNEKLGYLPSFSLVVNECPLKNEVRYGLSLNIDNQTFALEMGFNTKWISGLVYYEYEEDGAMCDSGVDLSPYLQRYGGEIRFHFAFDYYFRDIAVRKNNEVDLILNLDTTAIQVHISDVTVGDDNIVL